MGFNKSLLLIVSISSLLLSSNAVPAMISTAKPYFSAVPASRILVKPSLVRPSLSALVSASASTAPTPAKSNTGSLTGSAYKNAAVVTHQIIKPNPRVIEFCRGTENPALCAETIAPNFQGSFDPIKALETEIEATLNQSVKVANIISQSLNHPSKNTSKALDICKKQYAHIVDTIKEAVVLLNQQNVVDAYHKFTSVLADRSSCEDAFVKSPGVDIPFAEDSQTVYQLGGNCLAIMDGIVNHHIHY